jgi:7,8-dihydropterin-6-yl-methyl-4-(beta-D-ribofuranosyl)aminobenzene 5'-phosphate synthase
MKATKRAIVAWIFIATFLATSGAQDAEKAGDSAAGTIEKAILDKGLVAAVQKFKELRSAPPGRYEFKENEFNSLGYRLIRQARFTEAVRVFEMNVEMFPRSANVYDSLSEGYLYLGDRGRAEEVVKTALQTERAERSFVEQLSGALQRIDINDWRIRSETREVFRLRPGESTGLRGPYLGQEPPGETSKVFAPGIVSVLGNNDFCASFSPDGKEFYFNRGMTIMVCRLEKDGWTAPEPAAFSRGFRSHTPHLALDNQRMFFGGSRPPQPYGIWLTERTAAGWSEPRRMWDGMYATSSKTGYIYFGVEFPSPAGIVRTRFAAGRYAEPVVQAIDFGNVNSERPSIFHPGIAPDERFIVFDDNNGLYVSFREDDGSWGNAVPLGELLKERIATIPSVSPDGEYLFYAAHDDLHWVSARVLEKLRPPKTALGTSSSGQEVPGAISYGQRAGMGQEKGENTDDVVFTILYNNASVGDSIIADHGFSCLLESGDHSCLFDAGRISDKFMTNVSQLGVDCSRIDQVIVSHIHDDHMGGLFDILAKCDKPALCLPFSYPRSAGEPHTDKSDSDFHALLEQLKPFVSEIIQKKEFGKIGDRFYTTGMIDDQSFEHAWLVPTSKGLIILTGCAHPGILEIVKRARDLMKQDVYFVMGGFHLVSTDSVQVKTIAQELRKLTKFIGPCHCTGEKAQGIFKDVFQEDYIDIKAGLKLRLGDGKLK